MRSPPKQKRGLCGTALRNLQLRAEYQAVAFLAKVFEKPFWFFEQRRGRLMGRIANERSDQ
jgi:hypothetical protein